jgi:hypothetical protein
MIKLNYRTLGIIALGAEALASVASLLTRFEFFPTKLGNLIFLLVFALTPILGEIWAIAYWRETRNKFSQIVLILASIILLANVFSIIPDIRIITSRLFG